MFSSCRAAPVMQQTAFQYTWIASQCCLHRCDKQYATCNMQHATRNKQCKTCWGQPHLQLDDVFAAAAGALPLEEVLEHLARLCQSSVRHLLQLHRLIRLCVPARRHTQKKWAVCFFCKAPFRCVRAAVGKALQVECVSCKVSVQDITRESVTVGHLSCQGHALAFKAESRRSYAP